MAEIKSTIDIVMEKTAGIKLSDEERRQLEEVEENRAGQALVRRYFQRDIALGALLEKTEQASDPFQRAVLRSLVEGLQLGRENFAPALQALEKWRGTRGRSPLKQIRDLSLQFGQALQKRKKKVKVELWGALARRGIEGSAVEPNLEASSQWKDTVRKVAGDFEQRLETLKETLLKQLM